MPMRDVGVQYKTNGTGRDTYIYCNNGGYSDVSYGPNVYAKPGRMLPQLRYEGSAEKKPYIDSKAVHYRQNGSGRDTYILFNNGGYSNPNQLADYRVAFKNSLRQYKTPSSYAVKQQMPISILRSRKQAHKNVDMSQRPQSLVIKIDSRLGESF